MCTCVAARANLRSPARRVQTVQTVTMCRVLSLGWDDFMRLEELYPECTADLVSNLHAQAKATAATLASLSTFLDAPLPPAGPSPPRRSHSRSRSRSHSPRSSHGDPVSTFAGTFLGPPPSSAASARTGFQPPPLAADLPGSPPLSVASKRGSPRSFDVVAAAAAVAHESHAGAAYRLDMDGRPASVRTVTSDASTPRQDTLGIFMRTHSSNSAGGSQHTSAEITAHMNGGVQQPGKSVSRPLSGMAVNSMDIYAAQWMPSPRAICSSDSVGNDVGRPKSGPRSWFRGRSSKQALQPDSTDGDFARRETPRSGAVAESAGPVSESAGPVAESAGPVAESVGLVAESPVPVAESAGPVAESAGPVAEAARGGSTVALMAAHLESLDDIFLSSFMPIMGAMDAEAVVAEEETREALRKAVKVVVRACAIA